MTDYFEHHGRSLLTNGFLIIPIEPGHKRPAMSKWQDALLGTMDLASYPACGVGILCGQGANPIAALDIDTTHPALAAQFSAWCHDNLGATVERVGNAPKTMLVYRASEVDIPKRASSWFRDERGGRHRLEVLGRGQQFVAYHEHPDTKQDYAWIDLYGGLEATRAHSLPSISPAQIDIALRAFEAMAVEAGLTPDSSAPSTKATYRSAISDDPLMWAELPIGLSVGDAVKLLEVLGNEDYDTWLRAGMALHHEFGGSAEALEAWGEWSSSAANFTGADDLALRWQGFGKRNGHAPLTARWLLKISSETSRNRLTADKRAGLDKLQSKITACTESLTLMGELAEAAGRLADGDDDVGLRVQLSGLLRQRFRELTGMALSATDARVAMGVGRQVPTGEMALGLTLGLGLAPQAALPGVRSAPVMGRALTEFGNADRMLDKYGDALMYVAEMERWFVWTDFYWRAASGAEPEALAQATVRSLPEEALHLTSDAERVLFYNFCSASQKALMSRNMVYLLRSNPRVLVSARELDKHVGLLGVQNGVLELATGALLPPDQRHRITCVTGAEYPGIDGACPLFEQTVHDVFFGDPEQIEFFQRLVGYALMGNPKEDVLAIPFGSGANGKSTVLGAIREALGGYARTASASTFLSDGAAGAGSAGGTREDILRLRGARFVYISEPEEGSELREGLIKAMTGGEPMPARGMWSRNTVEVLPTWVAFMPTNHKPIIKGDDLAIWRRLLPIPFLRSFEKDANVDTGRADRLRQELPGILAWCARGALSYQRLGLKPPAGVAAAREEYKSDMDLLADWLNECCEQATSWEESASNLWVSWESFAKSRGELRYISSAKGLARRLIARGFHGKGGVGGRRVWVGVRLKALH